MKKRRNTAYLSLLRLGGKMILQPGLKVSVSDTAGYCSSISISPGLMWRESRPQTAPPSTQIDLLFPK